MSSIKGASRFNVSKRSDMTERTIRAYELIAANPGITTGQLGKMLGVPYHQAHHLLANLENTSMLIYEELRDDKVHFYALEKCNWDDVKSDNFDGCNGCTGCPQPLN